MDDYRSNGIALLNQNPDFHERPRQAECSLQDKNDPFHFFPAAAHSKKLQPGRNVLCQGLKYPSNQHGCQMLKQEIDFRVDSV